MPKPFSEGETINDWWPLENNTAYKYRITESRWEQNKKYIGREFTLKIVHANKTGNRFRFEVEGFDAFPYSELKIVENRLFLIHKENNEIQTPFLVFPLFVGICMQIKITNMSN